MAAIRDLILNLTERKEGNALTSAANDLEKLSRGVDASGNAMHDMENDAKKLNAEIEKSSARIKDLHKQFAATGDTSLFGDIRKEETRLRNLTKTFTALKPDFAKAGVDLGETLGNSVTNSFGKQLTSAFSGGGSATPGVIGGLVAGLLPLLVPVGAIVAGAVAGTIGTGGVIGGVLAASKDPRVRSAFQGFLSTVSDEFFSAGASFVDPIRHSLALLEKDFHSLDLGSTFALVAPDVEIIAAGLGGLVKNVMPGLNAAFSRLVPFAHVAAQGLAYLGQSLSEFLDNVTASPGAIEGLEFLFAGLGGTIKALGAALRWLSDRWAEFLHFQLVNFRALDATQDALGLHSERIHNVVVGLEKAEAATRDYSTATDKSALSTENYGESLTDAANKAKALADGVTAANEAIDKNINLATDAWGATINLAKGYSDLQDAINQGATGWDLNTRAGQQNQQMIEAQIVAAQHARDAAIALGDGTEAASNKAIVAYDKELAKILVYAAQLGATKDQLDAIAKTYYANLIVTVSERNQINKANAVDRALANLMGFAEGGLVPGPTGSAHLAIVHGGERVLTPPQQAAMASAPSGSDGASMQIIFGGNTDSAFATSFMKLVRSGDITISAKAVV